MTEETISLRTPGRVHFVGIGGSGMCALADILLERGWRVTGSDVSDSDNVERLRAKGIPVTLTQEAANVGAADLVVYTSAVGLDNPEVQEARRRRIPLRERGQVLGLLTGEFDNTVGVAGTHGKTTATSMLAQILIGAGLDPTAFIGGRLPLIQANGCAGGSPTMVCEACEFQDHYLSLHPAVAVILNVDADHLDYFGNLDGVIASFHRFAALASRAVVVNADDSNALQALEGVDFTGGKQRITYSMEGAQADWTARHCRMERGAYGTYDLYHGEDFCCTITLGVPGRHNIANSLAVAAAASLCGATPEQIAAGLAAFGGAGRRFERVGVVDSITVIDDYAHHPTEIEATLRTARSMQPARLWAVFQPFTYTRTARHLEQFAAVLAQADQVVLSDILGSREVNTVGVSSQQITDRIPGAQYIPTFEGIAAYVAAQAQPGDLVLTMGGGDIYKCARMIVGALQNRDV